MCILDRIKVPSPINQNNNNNNFSKHEQQTSLAIVVT